MTTTHRVLAAIIAERQATGVTPSYRQLVAALGLSSTSVAAYHCRLLERDGLLRQAGEGLSRAWVPTAERRVYGEEVEARDGAGGRERATAPAPSLHILELYVRGVEALLAEATPDARAHVESRTRFLRELLEEVR